MQPISNLASYARRKHGGARLARRSDGAAGNERRTVTSCCHGSRTRPIAAEVPATAGRLCQRLCETEAFSPADWQTLRLLGDDSSISARMACRSSEAEITGNSRTITQPRTQRKMNGCGVELFARPPARVEQNRRRHSKYAGNSSDSQQRLRKSSIQNA